jgi:hypothetical protein
MFWIEIILSIWALIAIRLLAQGHKLGPLVGWVGQILWVSMWIFTEQYGFILIDTGLAYIYLEAYFRGKGRC